MKNRAVVIFGGSFRYLYFHECFKQHWYICFYNDDWCRHCNYYKLRISWEIVSTYKTMEIFSCTKKHKLLSGAKLMFTPGVGNLLVVLCRSNVAKSLSVPTHPSPPYFYIQQLFKYVNLILSKLSF